jgi:putative glycosyltransferase (TIGR04372 family)
MSLQNEIRRAPRAILAILLIPLTFLPSLVMAALKVRLFRISVLSRIGHLAIEPDCYLKERELGRQPFARPIFLQRTNAPPANATMLEHWRKYIAYPKNPLLLEILRLFYIYPYLKFRATGYAGPVKETAGSYAVAAAWGMRPPLIALTPEEIARGEAELRRMGVPAGAWFVCVHTREAGYAPHDDDEHAYRNSPIADYRLATEAIAARGGWCIRMGDPSGEPMQPMANVIDYAHSEFRSEWMDVFLCARCRFFLGNTSGLFMVPTVFGVPVALANMAPHGCVYALRPTDLSIPKHVIGRDGGEMTAAEIFASPIADFRHTRQFAEAGVRVRDNTPEEIRDLALEMLDRLEGTAAYTEDDEQRQADFAALLRPGHYSYGSVARVGRDFLRANPPT